MATNTRVDEDAVVQTWERQMFDQSVVRGIGASVVFRGVPSDAGGPDYQDAVLSFNDRQIVSGDIEFHVLTSDWYRHGHQSDAHYNRVILHVVWRDDLGVTEREDGANVPIAQLGPNAGVPLDIHPNHDLLLPHRCIRRFAAYSADELRRRILALGMQRFEERADAFAADMTEQSGDQVLYAALLEALGYASNREVFRELAEAVPYWWLASVPKHEREAVLLDAAGLGPVSRFPPPVRLSRDRWRLVRVRPGNHPAVRLKGIAGMLGRSGPNLADEMTERIVSAKKPTDLRRALMVGGEGEALVGAGRADELAVSVVLPFVSAYSEAAIATEFFRRYPSPPANRWTRVMMELFSEAGHEFKPRYAPEHQGMHHLYHRFCRYDRRGRCFICGDQD